MFTKFVQFLDVEGTTIWSLDNGRVGVCYWVDLIDLEADNSESSLPHMTSLLQDIKPNVLCKMMLISQVEYGDTGDHSRSNHVAALGYCTSKFILSFEIEASGINQLLTALGIKNRSEGTLLSAARELLSSFDLSALRAAGVTTRSLTEDELQNIKTNSIGEALIKTPVGLDLGQSVLGIVRLVKVSPYPLNRWTLAQLKDGLPLPYRIVVNIKRVPPERAERILHTKTNQVKSETDLISDTKYQEAQETLQEVAIQGGALFEYEFLVVLERSTEVDLRKDAEFCIQTLKPLGEAYLENVGTVPSFQATQLGFDPHLTMYEIGRVLPCFLPLCTLGDGKKLEPKRRSLVIHRVDQSLTDVDIFNPRYDNYSACIFGKSGRGKSVLTNLMTRALHYDPSLRIIKIDVGGSHSKETELLGGREFLFSLSEPSGINPFRVLKERPHSEDICNVLATFLNVILLEQGEVFLSKEMRGDIEKAVTNYSLSRPKNPSLDDFAGKSPDLPRHKLLERWTGQGIYRNAFKEVPNSQEEVQRLRYYNFSQIFQANDPDFGQGGLAAVMAQFNLEMMTNENERLVFIADETPFFIERCFSFFKFSTANVRKFGGSFITIAQNSADVVINGDTGILDNSSMKFLFSVDGDKEKFAERFHISSELVEDIDNLKSEKGVFSEAMFLDQTGPRVLRIYLTREEYWRFTSTKSDNEKLNQLRQAVPGLTLMEAIRCLAR